MDSDQKPADVVISTDKRSEFQLYAPTVLFTLHAPAGEVISLKPDGSITYGPAFTTMDAAAKLFWDTVGGMLSGAILTKAKVDAEAAVAVSRQEDVAKARMETAHRCAAIVAESVDGTTDPFCCEPRVKEIEDKIRVEFNLPRQI